MRTRVTRSPCITKLNLETNYKTKSKSSLFSPPLPPKSYLNLTPTTLSPYLFQSNSKLSLFLFISWSDLIYCSCIASPLLLLLRCARWSIFTALCSISAATALYICCCCCFIFAVVVAPSLPLSLLLHLNCYFCSLGSIHYVVVANHNKTHLWQWIW